jgi:transketolase
VHPADYRFAIGRAALLREGSEVTLAACGLMVDVALRAAELLAVGGLSARVLSVSTLKPLDATALERAARETGALVTLEEHSVIGGLGSAICETLSGCCPVPVLRLGMNDEFGQSGSAKELLVHYRLTAEAAAELARQAVAMKRR